MVDLRVARWLAFRGFAVSLAALSAFVWIPLFIIILSPALAEPWKSAVVLSVIVSWIGGVVGLTANLRRDLTPVRLSERGLVIGNKVIPYADILSFDRGPSRRVFRVSLREPRRNLFLAKIGIESKEAFFRELLKRAP